VERLGLPLLEIKVAIHHGAWYPQQPLVAAVAVLVVVKLAFQLPEVAVVVVVLPLQI
jgi:hypothetical protein